MFTNGQLLHTLPFLESIKTSVLGVTAGTSWTWVTAGSDVYPSPPWDRVEYVQFILGFPVVSWLWFKDP